MENGWMAQLGMPARMCTTHLLAAALAPDGIGRHIVSNNRWKHNWLSRPSVHMIQHGEARHKVHIWVPVYCLVRLNVLDDDGLTGLHIKSFLVVLRMTVS
uniref:Uncharacterized protein n=1 Tax=Leersia perrieri TaxID=77586 RepID=A0A0D9VWV5_9ORYZ